MEMSGWPEESYGCTRELKFKNTMKSNDSLKEHKESLHCIGTYVLNKLM